ncbi:MAG TPA: short-chain dehydrogenase [Candidatus Polarisedimenticolia bacterium]|nr:short-chain dehydrogenase [Candidatus Polarisedimenticolia bacterium]
MEIEGRTVLVLGAWGLVGSAIARALAAARPARLVVHSLRRAEAEEAADLLAAPLAGGPEIVPAWGNIFVRAELRELEHRELLGDPRHRRALIEDTMAELSEELLDRAFLYRLVSEHRPDVVVDCINTATAFAYQDVFYSVRRVQKVVAAMDRGQADADALREVIEDHLTTLSLPQLIRHVQILREALRTAGTAVYLKIGTTGSGGMGLNIPYTHSEERPSRVLLSKSSIAGAHSMLLYLLARTPDAPVVKEIKPSAAIAWKRIGAGPVLRGGRPIPLYDCPPEGALDVTRALADDVSGWIQVRDAEGEPRHLESVYIDSGENGVFSCEEFETVTALGQMEFVTPEEIAADVAREIRGGTTGREIVSALDGATIGPSYRAGVMRHHALEEMHRLQSEQGMDSVAFEMLGPPRLSKLLYEGFLLRSSMGSLRAVANGDPAAMSAACSALVLDDADLRMRVLSIGLPIRLPDGRLLRGPEMKIPPYKEEAREAMGEAAVERWADAGWVDLEVGNLVRWRDRAGRIVAGVEALPADSSSAVFEDRRYWGIDEPLRPGRVAAWILGVEEAGSRGKAV